MKSTLLAQPKSKSQVSQFQQKLQKSIYKQKLNRVYKKKVI